MKTCMLKLIVTFIAFCSMSPILAKPAADENNTLYITLTNTGSEALHFERISDSRPDNHFTVNPQIINPGESTRIIAEKLADNDIEGHLLFANAAGDQIVLYILDQQQFHIGQPVFSVGGTRYRSTLVSKMRNRNIGPRYLSYIAADLKIIAG